MPCTSLHSAYWENIAYYVNIRIMSTTILPVFLFGCETWSLILREERKLMAFGNGLLRTIFVNWLRRGKRRMEKTT
jgi:hypothetical protein